MDLGHLPALKFLTISFIMETYIEVAGQSVPSFLVMSNIVRIP